MASQEDEPEKDDIIAVTNKIVTTKINLKNCFQLKITEVSELMQYDRIETGDNWQRVSTHLMNESRIFSYKVDSLYGDATKVVSNTTKFSDKTEEKPSFLQFTQKKAQNKCDPVNSHLDALYRQDDESESPIAMACLLPNKGMLLNLLPISTQLAVSMPFVSIMHSSVQQSSEVEDIDGLISRQFRIFKELTQFKQDCLEFVSSLELDQKQYQMESTEMYSFYGNTIDDLYNQVTNQIQQPSKILDSFYIDVPVEQSQKIEEVLKVDTNIKQKKKKNKKVLEPVVFYENLPKIFRSQFGMIKLGNQTEVKKKKLIDMPKEDLIQRNFDELPHNQPNVQYSIHHSPQEQPIESRKSISNVITKLKSTMLEAIRLYHPQTTLKSVLRAVTSTIQNSQMPFVMSALLHLCAQHSYQLQKSQRDITIRVADVQEAKIFKKERKKQSKLQKPQRARN